MKLFTLMLIVLATALQSVNSLHSIPALLWSPERSMSLLPEVKGVDPVNPDNFLNQYLNPLMDNPSESAVVFLQDKLHIDDFTRFADVYSLNSQGGAFKNIKSLMEDHFSLELPQVSNPCEAVEKLKASFSGDVHTVKSVEDVEGLKLDKGSKVMLIVQLNPVSGQKDKENAIQQNDATVGAISRHLQKRSIKYSALFTGRSASSDKAEASESHINRHLLAAETVGNGTFLNVSDGQIYVYLKAASVVLAVAGNTITLNLPLTNDMADNSTSRNNSAEIRFDFKKIQANGSEYEVSIVTEAQLYGDRWIMSRLYLKLVGGKEPNTNVSLENATLSRGDMDFTIPIIYSWHCTDMYLLFDTVNDRNLKIFAGSYVRLQGYQIQPFYIHNNRFFDAQDCVPYFTTAIWMFLFSAFFMISILIFGILMVLSLSTMDKYDDPKGKTITVAQGTE